MMEIWFSEIAPRENMFAFKYIDQAHNSPLHLYHCA